jgi:hypothetical protein
MIAAQTTPTVKARQLAAKAQEAEATVAELQVQLAAALAESEIADPKRTSLAFAARRGDPEAKAALDKLRQADAEREREIEDIRAALAEARRLNEVAHEAEDQRCDREQLAAAIKLGTRLVEISEAFDDACAEIRRLHDERAAVVNELLLTGTVPPVAALGFGGPDRTDSAIRYARAHSIYRGSPDASSTGDAPLADQDRRTVDKLTSPTLVKRMKPIF